ncbi:amino acid ABC transporter permease [Pseudonocardia alni]|uniref:Glutamate transport system permease protein n=1 Tax=Pseudonocardia alni TaxID=33907 RepID=A0A852W6W0_PSEA5|nr:MULTISPECIES: amino acid ABC transporter permease [Pseudonocardia]MYW72339.1 ABC transporter permease subunit [Pseudonocardia sp. SID8383]NWJ69213.1 amino acid ABC transporter permease [Pseudonocardia pini]WFG45099.1 amino acid ABC transporter permease [Pseudonocardia alni]ALE78490.1 amino acid ABC transporter permease [Pseudonocardia sp. AL041005-10]NYG04260.1 glutamate transport system permease protein [Pseudonocardia antarctica]
MNVLLDNADVYWRAILGTVGLFVVSAIGSLILGTLIAGLRVSPVPVLRSFGSLYVTLLRNTPLTLVLFFFAFAYPRLELVEFSFFTLACIGLTLYTAAFVCEIVRSGINTVPVGQAEAARALGFTFTQTLGQIVLPQAVRAVVPPMTNIQIALLKNTTIASGFAVFQLGSVYSVLSERGYNVMIGLLWIAAIFVVLVVPLTLLQRRLDAKWGVAR